MLGDGASKRDLKGEILIPSSSGGQGRHTDAARLGGGAGGQVLGAPGAGRGAGRTGLCPAASGLGGKAGLALLPS